MIAPEARYVMATRILATPDTTLKRHCDVLGPASVNLAATTATTKPGSTGGPPAEPRPEHYLGDAALRLDAAIRDSGIKYDFSNWVSFGVVVQEFPLSGALPRCGVLDRHGGAY